MINDTKLIEGIIVSVFLDIGPQVVFNSTRDLTEDQTLNLAIRVMTVVGEKKTSEVFGPFPVPDSDLYCLAYNFRVKSRKSNDPRLGERPTTICLIFRPEYKRDIVQVQSFIATFLKRTTENEFIFDSDLTQEKMKDLHRRLGDLISTKPIKVFQIDEEKSIEYSDLVLVHSEAYMIVDENKGEFYIIFGEDLPPLKKRKIIITADSINEHKYKRRLSRKILEDKKEINALLSHLGLKKEF